MYEDIHSLVIILKGKLFFKIILMLLVFVVVVDYNSVDYNNVVFTILIFLSVQ